MSILTRDEEIQAQIVATRTLLKELFTLAHQVVPQMVEQNVEKKRLTRAELSRAPDSSTTQVAQSSLDLQINTLEGAIRASEAMSRSQGQEPG